MLYIDSYENLPNSDDAYEQQALEFCKKWLSGAGTFLLHTSGSTGTPKPIELTRAQMIASAELTGKTFGLAKGDTALVCVNIEYIAGVMMLVRGMTLGLKLVIVPPVSNPFEKYPTLAKYDFDFVALVPLQIQHIIENEGIGFQKINQMKAIIVGGAAVNASLQLLIQQLSVPVFSTYGMTETVSHIAIKRLNKESRSDEFEILDGVEIKLDERSCLAIKAPASNHEWIFTNDVVELIGDKKFKILGRYDNIINSGGVKIQLEEVEKIVLELCKVHFMELTNKRFFAWGIPDDKLGQKLVLIWETNEISAIYQKSILAKCAEKLPKFKIPKAIFLVHTFIETPSGKIDKRAIAQSLLLYPNA